MENFGISYRTEGQWHIGVYQTDKRIGVLFRDNDKKWHLAIANVHPEKPVPTLTIDEMEDIIRILATLGGTDRYGLTAIPFG